MDIQKPKIGIIDDDEDIVELTKAFLKRRGFEVLPAYDGESGLDMVRNQKPDLVLLDLMLPGIDGYEVCRRIKEDTDLWHIPIIYFTARGEFSDKIVGLKSGGDDYVTKPFEPEELLARIWMILNRTYNVLDANPLTKLPGNNAIHKQIALRLEQNNKFAIAHMDIDHFKSFNDEYGFERGDQAIQGVAQILGEVVRDKGNSTDFIGHIGGDDYVLISEPNHIDTLCEEIIHRFDKLVPKLYDDKDRIRGYIVLKDRQGNLQEFPLMSLSIAVVTNEKRAITHIGQINAVAAELKKYAKTLPGSNFVKDRRDYEPSPKQGRGTQKSGRLEELAILLQEKKINLFFQPIMNAHNNTQQGYEATLRGLTANGILTEEEIYNLAIEIKMEKEINKLYFEKLRVFSYGIKKPSMVLSWIHPKVFLNILENSLDSLKDLGFDPELWVYQVKARDFTRYDKMLKDIIDRVYGIGSRISIALFWGAPVPLTLMLELKPQFIYLDQLFIDKIDKDATQQTILKLVVDMARVLKCQLLVSGVSTENQKEYLKASGISLMTGTIFA